jgi:hypothetical protein
MSSNDEQPAGAGRHAMSGRDRDGERLEALLAEHDAILAQEPARVSARQRLIEIQDECFAILGEQGAGRRG